MQDFSPQGQDGVRCLVVAFLLLRSFVLRFAVHYRRLAFSRACRTARTSGNRTRDRSIETADFGDDDNAGASNDAKYGIGERMGDRVPVFRDEKGDPSTRTSPITFASFFCSDLRLRSAFQLIFHAQIRRNRANIGTGTLWGLPNQLAHFLCEF